MSAMDGRQIGRVLYAPIAAAAVLSQHAAVALAYAAAGRHVPTDVEFWLVPLRTFARLGHSPPAVLAAALLLAILSSGAVATASLWRARDAARGHVAALMTLIPVVQIPAIVALAALPSAKSAPRPQPALAEAGSVADIALGVVVGMGLCVFAVVVSALLFREYGYGLFVLAPLLMGLVTGYLANRRTVIPPGDTTKLVLASASLGGAMLIAFALEGLICLLMAAPLALLCAWIGGHTGREMAIHRRGNPTVMSLAALPLVFLLEAMVPAQLQLDSADSIVVDAPPAQVWKAVIANEDIGPAPALPFRLGLAYPIASELRGEGVGAERIGHFSTGVARERVTVWEPGRRLAFRVLSSPPVMHELSPWPTVHAPHVVGYFQTAWTSFDLAPLPQGRTRLTVRAAHTLRLDPAPYWEPLARLAIEANNRRVLVHYKARAEAASQADVYDFSHGAIALFGPRREPLESGAG